VPTFLKVLTVSVLPTGSSGDYGCLPSANYGIMLDIKYQVLDQNLAIISSSAMRPQETGVSFDGIPYSSDVGPSRISTTSQFTAADGTYHDAPVGYCQSLPFQTNQTLSNTQDVTILFNGQSYPVRNQGFTVSDTAGANGFGHGSIQNSARDVSASR
jgi:hypothetical protein